jgi:hypothetical protein
MLEAARLNLSSSAPLNRRPKSLQMLALDLEAEPPAGAEENGYICRKGNQSSILVLLLVIIHVTAQ